MLKIEMNKNFKNTSKIISAVLLIFWGSFFIEHLSWFFQKSTNPPFEVFVISFFHLMLLVGYIIYIKWVLAGSIIILISATIFLTQAMVEDFFIIWLLSIMPALMFSLFYIFKKSKDEKEQK